MIKDKALKLARDCLRDSVEYKQGKATAIEAVEDIDEALAQPEQEPEPWSNVGIGVDVTKEGVSVVGIYKLSNDSSHLFYSQLYTTPPQRTWVGLTFAEICECESEYLNVFARAIEAKLRSKNT